LDDSGIMGRFDETVIEVFKATKAKKGKKRLTLEAVVLFDYFTARKATHQRLYQRSFKFQNGR
jgi:hypothetical protein